MLTDKTYYWMYSLHSALKDNNNICAAMQRKGPYVENMKD